MRGLLTRWAFLSQGRLGVPVGSYVTGAYLGGFMAFRFLSPSVSVKKAIPFEGLVLF